MRILVTGGAGYIGSHTSLQLAKRGDLVTVLDNLNNSSRLSLARVSELTGQPVDFIKGDLLNAEDLEAIFSNYRFDAVVHFAGLKAVGESVENPLLYYQNNVTGTLNLLHAMQLAKIKTFVFSSSATVYGDPEVLPITEEARFKPTNPYGHTKAMVEQVLVDLCASDPDWHVASLRYFNPVGAHPSGSIGEDPLGVPNNLMPFISQVATGRRETLSVFGDDYDTPDGTGVRDYIHVMDLAQGHLAALDYLKAQDCGKLLAVNLGTGCGISVLEMIESFEKASGKPIPYNIVGRRAGDIASCYADPSLAENLLGWKAELDVEAMCANTWHWQSNNPKGYCADGDTAASLCHAIVNPSRSLPDVALSFSAAKLTEVSK